MDSELEDCNDSKDLELLEMNGDLKSPQKNGNHDMLTDQNSLLPDEHISSNTSDGSSTKEEDPLSVKKINKTTTSENKIVATETVKVNNDKEKAGASISDETGSQSKPKADTNGNAQVQTLSKDGKPLIQRRMSLRSRAMPKKYADADGSDEEPKDPLATKDPLEIPLGKSTVLIRNASTPSQLTVTKSANKSPIKLTKVTRPPPELIKAPIANKISISSTTSVTIVPRAKENHSTNNSGYVVVDTQSILKGKTSVVGSTVPASVTVSAVPSLPKSVAPKLASTHATVSAPVNKKSTSSANNNSASLPDPFESLGLADDSFIVEAPSFVVPYLIEKVALEDLKKTVETLKPPPKKNEEVVELSEEDSNDSDKKSKDETKTPDSEEATAVALEKSSMKSEMDKSVIKNKEEEEYFTGPIGRFFLDIGLSLVQEYVQGDLLRVQKRKVHKGTKISDPSLSVNALSKGLDITRAKNDPYRLPWRHCDKCNFKSESNLILAHHWSLPLSLGSGPTARYGCHWCSFEAKESHLVVTHIETDHGMKSRLGPDLPPHQCPLCPFEDNVKSKVTRHIISCQKRFIAERNLEPPLDWEPPAKIPRMPARGPKNSFSGGLNTSNSLHGYALATAKGLAAVPYHPLLPKSALMNTLGYSGLPSTGTGKSTKGTLSSQANIAGLRLPNELHVVQGPTHRGSTGASMGQGASSQSKTPYRQPASNQSSHYLNPSSYAVPSNQIYQAIAKSFQLLHGQGATMSILPSGTTKHPVAGSSASDKLKKNSNSSSISLVSGLVNTSGLTIQSSSTTPSVHKSKTNQQPSISITPLPRSNTTSASTNKPSLSVTPVTAVNSNATASNSNSVPKAGQPTTPGQKGGVVCEICDGSIKDLEQLRHHMQWIHKVKIHPKMIHNRPPLNCQKCQCRFFTDQGLERHLLGSHGLVTSSMQEAANRGQDGGRCPICGKVHQWKLLSHVVKDHGLSLKPAHLSYKCTVCTATFTMYKLFENHVYTAHSVVARKVLDKEKSDGKKSSSSNAAGALRINDEITIIPQTTRHDSSDQNVCRPSRGEKRNRVDIIDLSDEEDKDGLNLPKSQVTITKVPAPKGYFSKNSRESLSKRSRTEDIDTE